MKPPAFLAGASATFKRVGRALSAPLAGAGAAVAGTAATLSRGIKKRMSGLDRTRLKFIGIAAGALAGAFVFAVLLGVLIAGAGTARTAARDTARDTKLLSARTGHGAKRPNGIVPSMPETGPALAARLLIPKEDEWPWPLALEPRERYTDAEADAMRPDLGAVDLSEAIRRRKAELEAIYGAVD